MAKKQPNKPKPRKRPKSAYALKRKGTAREGGGKKGMSHSAKPDDLRDKAPNGEVVVRRMTDEDRARFEARRGTGK
ncbi:hypothetical protein [Leifsonia aquatica]|uniref:hypothetical protein n=1 Tax=Leifsonia aquatica TaxID=144185 RepID=UPI00046807FC|nr:hypothetical protein [Leifsonia aquatica]